MVSVRVRPLSKKELISQTVKNVRIIDQKIVVLKDETEAAPEDAFRQGRRSKEMTFAFDFAFDEDIK